MLAVVRSTVVRSSVVSDMTSPPYPDVEVVDDPAGAEEAQGEERETVTQPQKLIRIASMVRNMLEEVRRAPLDDAGRQMLRQIHDKSLAELEDVLSEDLREELAEVVLPFSAEAPSESELRIAQAQLVGWLEGLFHGIQASMFSQQMAAQQQMEQIRRRALMPGMGGDDGPGMPGGPGKRGSGYL
jgi:hypothetical protein